LRCVYWRRELDRVALDCAALLGVKQEGRPGLNREGRVSAARGLAARKERGLVPSVQEAGHGQTQPGRLFV
jgi:hypothetical protein